MKLRWLKTVALFCAAVPIAGLAGYAYQGYIDKDKADFLIGLSDVSTKYCAEDEIFVSTTTGPHPVGPNRHWCIKKDVIRPVTLGDHADALVRGRY